MRTPSTAVRGVFVIVIILGVVFISNISMVQSGAEELLLEETPSPTPTSTPNVLYYPVIKNKYGFLYSSVVTAGGQGFDHCYPFSVEGMQEWWDHSPYSTVNIYLGGISAWCPFDELDIDWYTRIAEQGWTFILTWVGPQAPIKNEQGKWKFKNPMSTNPALSYIEGKLEAFAAVETAEDIGFKGQLVIYYDVESYSGADEDTRAAVAAFIQGWTEQLHELDHIAGAYGAACTSYVVDWAFNDPPVDNVWVAKWNKVYEYDPDASVYDTTCVDTPGQPPIFWTNHQRLKQYTGDHYETWGSFSPSTKIDSDVLDGQIVALFGQPPVNKIQTLEVTNAAANSSGPGIHEFQLLSPSTGWVLSEDRLLWTEDGGDSWQEKYPTSTANSEILGVYFSDTHQGWAAIREASGEGGQSLVIYHTQDSGHTWAGTLLSDFSSSEVWEIESASFEFLDSGVGWLALKLVSGINFSFGRLLATEDGGESWQERSLPLGEPVSFADENNGWTAGGPLDQVYSTNDGGASWSLSEDTNPDEVKTLSSEAHQFDSGRIPDDTILLKSISNQIAWAVVQGGSCTGYKLRPGEQLPAGEQPLQCEFSYNLMKTSDGGLNWTVAKLLD